MTILEKKLKEMGYIELWGTPANIYSKNDTNEYIYQNIELDRKCLFIKDYYVSLNADINSQNFIDDIQIAFNNVRRDFEELKESIK